MNDSSKEPRKVRFGIMCNGTSFQAWQAACLGRLLALENVEPALLIVDDEPSDYGGLAGYVRKLRNLRNLFWYVYSAMGRIISRAMRPVDMRDALAGVPVLRCRVQYKGKYSQYFREEDIDAIRAHGLDFILRFGFNIIRGEILEVPRYGVWSFHHDDENRYRGGPPCFWEIYKGDPVVGAILQRLTDRLDSGIVLKKGFFKTVRTSYIRNRDRAFFESTEWPAQVCTDILNGKTAYIDASPSTTNAPILRAPDNARMLIFMLKVVGHVFAEAATKFFVADRWNVGIVDQPISAFLNSGTRPAVRWFPPPARNRFNADPFAIRTDDAVHVLYEDFDFYTSRGRISTVRVGGEGISASRKAMDEPFHLSHPYLLEHEGAVYCVPESNQNNEVALYRADDFPNSWTKVATLIGGFAGVDSTVFQHEGLWWLLATDQNDGPNHKLRAWHAKELTGPWEPHALNPIKMDIRSSRPAGTPFVHNGCLYRPSQDCSRSYGERITLNRVLKLTPEEFEEEQVGSVEPFEDGPYPDGIHTIAGVGEMTVVDGMRKTFIGVDPSMWVHKLRRIFTGV